MLLTARANSISHSHMLSPVLARSKNMFSQSLATSKTRALSTMLPSHTSSQTHRTALSAKPKQIGLRSMSTMGDQGGRPNLPPVNPPGNDTAAMTNHPDYVGSRGSRSSYPRGMWGMGWPIIPDNANEIAHDDPGRYKGGTGFRYDHRSPSEMIAAGAFNPRGKNMSITAHQAGDMENSGLVSFAAGISGANVIRQARAHERSKGDYTYHLAGMGPHDTFEVGRFYRPGILAADVNEQMDVVSPRIALSNVIAVDDHAAKVRHHYPFTPITGISIDELTTKLP